MRENTEQECKNLLKKAFFFFLLGRASSPFWYLSAAMGISLKGSHVYRMECYSSRDVRKLKVGGGTVGTELTLLICCKVLRKKEKKKHLLSFQVVFYV